MELPKVYLSESIRTFF